MPIPERIRRLWKRRLRRRPLLPFLLAATLAIDAVLAVMDIHQSLTAAGFLLAQMSLFAIWICSAHRGVVLRASFAFACLIVLIEVFLRISDRSDSVLGPVLLAVMGGKCLAACLVFLAKRFFAPSPFPRPRWKFSIGSLMTASLVIAFAGTTANQGDWSVFSSGQMAELVAGETVVVLIMASLSLLPNRRYRQVLLVGLPVLAILLVFVSPFGSYLKEVLYYSCVQATVMGVWLACLQVTIRRKNVSNPRRESETERVPLETSESDDFAADRIAAEATEGKGHPEFLPHTLPLHFDALA